MEVHNIEPIFNENAKILILGTFPSVKSREQKFFYLHPQNRFWKVISNITNETFPDTIEDKKQLLLKNNMAVWDVIKSCDIIGSSDNSIENVIPNDLNIILNNAHIQKICVNRSKAYKLFRKYYSKDLEIIRLPSTSPANARYGLEELCRVWKQILI